MVGVDGFVLTPNSLARADFGAQAAARPGLTQILIVRKTFVFRTPSCERPPTVDPLDRMFGNPFGNRYSHTRFSNTFPERAEGLSWRWSVWSG